MAKAGRPKGSVNKDKPKKIKDPGPAKKTKKAAAAPAAEAADERRIQVITKGKLNALLSELDTLTKDAQRPIGKLRERLADAKKNDFVHTGALAVLRKIRKMEVEEGAIFWDVLGLMMEDSGELERLSSAPMLHFMRGGKPVDIGGTVEVAAEPDDGKVVPMKAREVQEQAGAA